MLSTETLPSITRLQLPARYQIANATAGLTIRQLLAPEREVGVQLERFRSRGESCRRVLARTEHAEQFVLEFATFSDCYDGDLTGVLRGRSAIVSDGTLALEAGHFRQEPV